MAFYNDLAHIIHTGLPIYQLYCELHLQNMSRTQLIVQPSPGTAYKKAMITSRLVCCNN